MLKSEIIKALSVFADDANIMKECDELAKLAAQMQKEGRV